MVNDTFIDELVESVRRGVAERKRLPVSVYRLQFNRSFTFSDASKVVPYLYELGITDCYASPYLRARSGSMHGYDISDHNAINPEIGSRKDFNHFVSQLQKFTMGQILDFIPNHMGIFDNPRWQDILKNGPSSFHSRFFDIDWEPIKPELHQKVLLPILEDLYGVVLEKGMLVLTFEEGAFAIKYHSHSLPVDPKTAVTVLDSCLSALQSVLGTENADYLELQSIVTACKNLPERHETTPEKSAERHREGEIIERRLWGLYQKNEEIKKAIDAEVKILNGKVGNSYSFSRLHNLLEAQAYRLSYWRVAAEEINYRRFFDINELVALRMQDPVVFSETHRLLRELLLTGAITGVRIDHVDGLFNPESYLWRLQKAAWIDLCLRKAELDIQFPKADRAELEEKLSQHFDQERASNPASPAIRPVFVVVEKILSEKETLRDSWPIDGTTGYEFMIALNQIFIDRRHQGAMLDTYRWFTHNMTDFPDIVYHCKNLVMRTTMSAEINILAHQLSKLAEKRWQYRDFTLNSLRDAIREVIACFPVYRTYINAYEDTVDENDQAVINNAIFEAKKRNPAVSSAIFDFVRNTLLLQYPPGLSDEALNDQRAFVMRFQQFTGPVMAKGMEDTAFYLYNPLASLCEVGGYPQRFGTSVEEFQRHNLIKHRTRPHSFIATSSHDSKRSEDVRARINVLSEMSREWRAALARWSRMNRSKKIAVNSDIIPDGNEEYLIYQTLLGTYPWEDITKEEQASYLERIQTYMLKAVREAKVHTSWVSPNTAYEQGISQFIAAILEPSESNAFLSDFKNFNRVIVTCGWYNSLSQVVIKLFSPGTPDIYQGNEIWTYNLTDPDNRRPVDFSYCANLLKQIKKMVLAYRQVDVAKKLLAGAGDGRIKLYVTWKSLTYRRTNAELFNEGSYIPLKVAGTKKNHVCAFAWKRGKRELIVIAPRLIAGLTRNGAKPPLGIEAWGDTHIILPHNLTGENFKNLYTGETVTTGHRERGADILLADALKVFPVAALELISD
jgi:(1->4)-alpha-D-glucan 1-alpha-D-glucosylmutase